MANEWLMDGKGQRLIGAMEKEKAIVQNARCKVPPGQAGRLGRLGKATQQPSVDQLIDIHGAMAFAWSRAPYCMYVKLLLLCPCF